MKTAEDRLEEAAIPAPRTQEADGSGPNVAGSARLEVQDVIPGFKTAEDRQQEPAPREPRRAVADPAGSPGPSSARPRVQDLIPGMRTAEDRERERGDTIAPDGGPEGDRLFPSFRASDALPQAAEDSFRTPNQRAQGKSNAYSLMRPQQLAMRLLPAKVYKTLHGFAVDGCRAECGPPWTPEVIEWALRAGPHVSALTEENVYLIWDDVQYQERAGFVRIVPESELFGAGVPEELIKELKISRLAVVPQANRRGRLILNLSAPVELPAKRAKGSRHKRKRHQASVNETTEEPEDQEAVKALGTALPSLLLFMFETKCDWEIDWQKIDLSDGFWRMIVEHGKEYNFVYQLPPKPGSPAVSASSRRPC